MRRVLAVVLALGLAACAPAQVQPFDPFHQARVTPPKDARAPLDGAFRDQQDRPVTLRNLAHGRPIVLVPVQYRCPNLCGLMLTGLDQAAPDAQAAALVALGIDPREGPADAAKAVSVLHAPIAALTGPDGVTGALGYRYAWDGRLQQYAHLSAAAVLAPDGRLVRWLAGPKIDPAALAASLEEARGGPPAALPERLLLLCYHLVPQGGVWDRRVIDALQVMGGLTIVLMLLALRWMTGREGRRS